MPEPAGTTGSGGAILQIPVVLGGIAMAYNEPCLGAHTQLTGTQIAQIFAGKITDWNKIDGSCAAGSNIVPVHRADSSGTTNAFTHYMTAVDPADWPAANDGKTSSGWVGGLGGNGNAGVAGDVADTPGAIGYVELAYALQSGLNYAAVQNAAGQYVVPNEGSVAADAAAFPNVSPTNYLIVNGSGAGVLPDLHLQLGHRVPEAVQHEQRDRPGQDAPLDGHHRTVRRRGHWLRAVAGQHSGAGHLDDHADGELRRPTALQLIPEGEAHQRDDASAPREAA